ncbi:MAG TPA: L-fucose:H+ symporter permease [Cyclobacteriaceae bacterium]|nr:L-fucose:H+ symporter permease [Cyclobacteriaceae bacterium]
MIKDRKFHVITFALVTSLFFLWGLANNMTDTLLAAFKRIMSMTDFQTSWIQIAFYGSYFCLALPAAILIKKYSYKTGILTGLGMYFIGGILFYPASKTMDYSHFLIALFILAGGLSVLETTANPYIIAIGPEETGTRRLNFAQSFNPIGSITGVVLSKLFILSNLEMVSAEQRAAMSDEQLSLLQSRELNAVMGPYVGVAIVLLILWMVIGFRKMPEASEGDSKIKLFPTIKRLVSNQKYIWGVVAQFFYVGAQLCAWSFTIRYVMSELHINEEQSSNYYIASLVFFVSMRFVNTALMRLVSPSQLLTGSSLFAILFTVMTIFGKGSIGVYSLVAISGCMSLMFPTIYGLAVRGLGEDSKIGASGMIMAIVGGAVFPAIQGKVSDLFSSINISFSVPLTCFIFILIYSFFAFRKKPIVDS